ncbi:conserved hypothetical protein [Acinetobacter proteolyticus]|uniref:Uncharacterized protein n=1 Tax=Acinetobacter proteolyticus TaxID=1776741 RepID=A0A653KBC0_9GAMM|nr:hypothetical protein [Acinetobacter proteolyticus]VXA57369.1 conserved hypothetical protein [Acinetobacter proteolyticus]
MTKYIPNPDQEEESLITAKIDSELEKLRKKLNERTFVYFNKDKKSQIRIYIRTSLRS